MRHPVCGMLCAASFVRHNMCGILFAACCVRHPVCGILCAAVAIVVATPPNEILLTNICLHFSISACCSRVILVIPNVVRETKSETTFVIKLDLGDYDDNDDDDFLLFLNCFDFSNVRIFNCLKSWVASSLYFY